MVAACCFLQGSTPPVVPVRPPALGGSQGSSSANTSNLTCAMETGVQTGATTICLLRLLPALALQIAHVSSLVNPHQDQSTRWPYVAPEMHLRIQVSDVLWTWSPGSWCMSTVT